MHGLTPFKEMLLHSSVTSRIAFMETNGNLFIGMVEGMHLKTHDPLTMDRKLPSLREALMVMVVVVMVRRVNDSNMSVAAHILLIQSPRVERKSHSRTTSSVTSAMGKDTLLMFVRPNEKSRQWD
jgi:hypothetical protein